MLHVTHDVTTGQTVEVVDDPAIAPIIAASVRSAAEQDARLDDHDERLARIEAKLWPADPDPEPDAPIDAPTWGDLGGVWPNGQLLSDGGTVWRNVSGVPLTTPPSGFPGTPSQWAHLFVAALATEPDPDPTAPAWSASASYEVGDRVTHNGQVWECLVAHGAEQQGQWQPGVAHNVWTPV